MSYDKLFDQVEDGVDPRVQVELERLNTSTDEINKLEVDLDEARNQFRHLLQESTTQIEHWSKKLGVCIVKVRPYYDARIQAKEALQETQRAASKFERANSAHAAAKEMVYLAEEGLKAEGRTFDHAWQEMLNHATMRVNESEAERTKCEAEHRKKSQNYQLAESRVRSLQKELKRAITKSRPYFELKIHYMQLLEKQKAKVKNLEKQVADVKLTYAHTLKNLEQISDEIHKTRQKKLVTCDGEASARGKATEGVDSDLNRARERCDAWMRNGTLTRHNESSGRRRPKVDSPNENDHGANNVMGEYETGADDGCRRETLKILSPIPDAVSRSPTHTSITTFSSQPDTDFWSENSEENFKASPSSENESSLTEPPDTESEEETFRHPGKRGSAGSAALSGESRYDSFAGGEPLRRDRDPFQSATTGSISRGVGLEFDSSLDDGGFASEHWTEIKLRSPEEELFSTVKVFNAGKGKSELEEFNIPYAPLAEAEGEPAWGGVGGVGVGVGSGESGDARLLTKRSEPFDNPEELATKSLKGTPRKMNLRRQSLDVLWNSSAGEKVKEILSQGILRLSISTLAEKKPTESKAEEGNDPAEARDPGPCAGTEASGEPVGTPQFGINFFNRKNSKMDDDVYSPCSDEKRSVKCEDSSGRFKSRKERFFNKKIPSPLERTLNYLNTDEESNSDSESLSSLDVFTDEQLSSLVLDRDLAEIYQDIV